MRAHARRNGAARFGRTFTGGVTGGFCQRRRIPSYAGRTSDQLRRATQYIDKILKGARPADLPIQLPTRFDLKINLRVAKAIGLSIPPGLLARADDVLE